MCADMYPGGLSGRIPSSLLGLRIPRHKVFVSYHHANDQMYRESFEALFASTYEIMVSKSVQIGDIDPSLRTETIRQKIRDEYLADSTVTIVLVGSQTWQRKHVDWEIASSIRDTVNNPRSGLLGILLPSFQMIDGTQYEFHKVPPRLYDNVNCGFADMYRWSNDPHEVATWINDAYARRTRIIPDNSYPSYANNRTGERWY